MRIINTRINFISLLAGCLLILNCGNDMSGGSTNAGLPKDAIELKRFDVMDNQGFSQPMTVLSFLAPADWKLEGGAQWNFNTQCSQEIVSIQARVTSPDGKQSFEVFPQYTAFWGDNQIYNDITRNKGCNTGPPFSSADFIKQLFIPGFRQGAQVVSLESRPKVAQAEYQKEMTIYGDLIRQMNATLQVDVSQARIQHSGSEEWVVAIVDLVNLPQIDNTGYGNSFMSYVTTAKTVLSFRTPQGQLDANQKLFATIMGSYRINYQYTAAIRKVKDSINRIAMQGMIDRHRIRMEANRQAQQTRMDTWKYQNESNDRSHEKWIQAIRGTESYSDPQSPGTTWELNAGYDKVWKTGSDTFILTNDQLFDPNVELGDTQDWQLMTKQK